ncbi:M20 family metallo-hydrolase [Bacillus sp. S/N-304-OC-R1]|uniref:M20 family metallo-hydrolase n=1 Tax=Bacillus sp. S/N-304-OC-R1 TaxID=2758034 RepID=UPI001C8DBEC3|nr:M20 family metallo-hydrolase [Bacillus sp. S/N-304-OC-R1]MBY0124310.1 M20 family metallo-hydrolase [Bacillus sp. S/N-304-OC-R1]
MDLRERYEILLNKMNQYNSGEIGITRVAYTNEEQAGTHAFMRLCKDENLDIRLDPCGNLIARREGKIKGLPPVVIGSHLDTVYQGGRYDGIVGVTAGLEVIKRLNDKGIVTDHPIEVVSFACEESSRFGVSTVGSKAMAGLIDKEKYRNLKDRDGITMEKALALCALDFNSIDEASRAGEEFKAYLELHVEQGPVLINNNKKIGVVTGIAAPIRLLLRIFGKASHSGTTPMNMRKDALLGASEIALEVEKAAMLEQAYGTVGTVGVLDVPSGAMNVVPGEVELKIDIRSTSTESRERVLNHVYNVIDSIKDKRELEIDCNVISMEDPVILSPELVEGIRNICENKNLPYEIMQSGAGHDAMNMTRLGPVGLIFVPSVDGLSHHPDEYTDLDDILLGIDVLEEAVIKYAAKA